MKDTSKLAFPSDLDCCDGMTLREYYAAKALQVLAAKADRIKCPKSRLGDVDTWRRELAALVAKKCFIMADAMIEEGNK